ncbi:hypothetical protein L596_030578 [Steinernema carpocapsae]|uniref:Uncharacterized protein n=1 Tax=Steinernema carpocapsae TaxID=34508 RepID=A0A4U5LPV3_STECR|nr:hypothetical protein L596_030578 [Steinernema carpocapsae]
MLPTCTSPPISTMKLWIILLVCLPHVFSAPPFIGSRGPLPITLMAPIYRSFDSNPPRSYYDPTIERPILGPSKPGCFPPNDSSCRYPFSY